MKKVLYFSILVFMMMSFFASNSNAQITIGANPYTDLKSAFTAINNGVETGAITININSSFTEPDSATLNASGTGSASYTSVLIKPTAPGLTITGNTVRAVINLLGADNVTIDGRVGVGVTRELTILNNATTTLSAVIKMSSMGVGLGATNNIVQYCNIKTGQNLPTVASYGIYIAGLTMTATGTGADNDNNTISNNAISKAAHGIYTRGTSTANPNQNTAITNNIIGGDIAADYVVVNGIDMTNSNLVTISNNRIYNMIVVHTAIVRAINLSAGMTNVTINANVILDIKNNTTGSFVSGQGIFISGTGAVNATISNNSIAGISGGLGSGTATNNVWGIMVAAGNSYNIFYNSISITGTPPATGSVDRLGCLAFNSAASTGLVVNNNIFYNTRPPGNVTSGGSYNIYSVATVANLTSNYNDFYISGTRVFTGFITSADRATLADWQAATTQDANSINGNPLFANALNYLPVGSTSPCLNAGTPIAVTTDILGVTRNVTTPTIGAYENPVNVSDAGVTILYTLGYIPVNFGANHVITAIVSNLGNQAITNLNVTLDISGANSFNNVKVVASLPIGASETVTFDPFTPTATGTNNVMVSVPITPDRPFEDPSSYDSKIISTTPQYGYFERPNLPVYSLTPPVRDMNKKSASAEMETLVWEKPEVENDNAGANSFSVTQEATVNQFSYAIGTVATGGVGFNGGTGDFVAKFTTAIAGSLNQVDVNFVNGGQPFIVGVWDATGLGGSPGTLMYETDTMTSASGVFTVIINPALAIPAGSFYVGVRQIGTVNVSFAYQTENPIRSGTFYFASPTGSTTWNDFAPNNFFRFMISPKFALAHDVSADGIDQVGTNYYNPGTIAIPMTGSVINLGTSTETFDVNRKVYDGNTVVYDNTITVNNLASNASAVTTFANFTTFVSGTTYTIVDSTRLGTDQNIPNNRFSSTFTPFVAKTACILWADAGSRDSLIAQMNTYTSDYDVVSATGFTGSFRAWKTVFYVLASTGNWTAAIRDSLKAYLDASPFEGLTTKRTLVIFGNDLGYNNDPIRNGAALAADTLFYRQYLGGTYMADSWLTAVPTATRKFYGAGPFSSVTADSSSDSFPDMVRPSDSNPQGQRTSGFYPLTVDSSSSGDSACALYYSGTYNLFYGTNTYSAYRTRIGVVDNPLGIFVAIKDWIEANGGILPVELMSFTYNVNRNIVNLNWSTNSEINNSGFDIERRIAGSNTWSKIGNVEGSGNTNEPKNYSFTDNGLQTGKYNYRLKQIDFNGNYEYHNLSGEVIVGVPGKFDLSQNYPNPFNPVTKINYDLPVDGKVNLRIYDITGREVANLVNGIQTAGYYTIQFNASNFASGVYFYRIISEGTAGQQFVMTKKMVLVK
ncbi:MAG TPA: T9SS type A sorting domain-containing protein [Ignavibacteria bacterium]|nr:T9SS type A sorting domain-containing protein [Ignavibacteria bacterium]